MKIAFAGFRHGHIFGLYNLVKEAKDVELAAACEEDAATRKALAEAGTAAITHDNYLAMLDGVQCDAVAIGDYYGKRGALAIEALKRGKHVIADKPLCTSLAELDEIERLAAAKNLKTGLMLDLRDLPQFRTMKKLVREGLIGTVHAVAFGGQHPLMSASRPAWYFEPGKHGGTINDIGIHGFDAISWITGLNFTVVNAARSWNAFAGQAPHMKDAGQMMLTMENGCGVLGDVSYFMPDTMGYALPQYWRMTFYGRKGVIETSCTIKDVMLALNGKSEVERLPVGEGTPGGYLDAFRRDVAGRPNQDELTTAQVLRASRTALMTQKAGDEGLREVSLG